MDFALGEKERRMVMRLIDADELLTAFPVDDEPTVTKSCVRMTIQWMPTVDATPVRRGRWVPKFGGIFKCGAYWYDCSECGHTVPGGLQSGKNFCENCGADMRGDDYEVD
jgi:hypothetical protein